MKYTLVFCMLRYTLERAQQCTHTHSKAEQIHKCGAEQCKYTLWRAGQIHSRVEGRIDTRSRYTRKQIRCDTLENRSDVIHSKTDQMWYTRKQIRCDTLDSTTDVIHTLKRAEYIWYTLNHAQIQFREQSKYPVEGRIDTVLTHTRQHNRCDTHTQDSRINMLSQCTNTLLRVE